MELLVYEWDCSCVTNSQMCVKFKEAKQKLPNIGSDYKLQFSQLN